MVNPNLVDFKLYRYTPSLTAAVIFIICFGICACLHAWKIYQKRIFYFIPLLVGALFEVIGYIGRAVSSSNPLTLGPYVTQALTILLAPPLFTASIYMVLGRTISLLHAEHFSIIPVKWLTRIFVGGDVLSFLTQSAGGGIQTGSTLAAYDTGQDLIMAGLGIQLAFFGFFIIVAALFHYRIAKNPTPMAISMGNGSNGRTSGRSWQSVLWTLYAVSLLILIRSIFRMIEYAGGNDGYLISHEAFLYIFDAVLMFGVLIILFIFHPAEVVPGKKVESDGGLELS